MPAEGSSNGSVERIIPIHRESGSSPLRSAGRIAPTAVSPPPTACPERIIPIVREATPPAPSVNGTSAVKRQQVPTVIGFKHSYFSPISSNSNGFSDRNGGSVGGKPIVVRKLSPLSPKHIVMPVGSGGVKPAPPVKPDYLKSPPMSPVPSEEPLSNRSSPLHYYQHPLRSTSVSNSSLAAAIVGDSPLVAAENAAVSMGEDDSSPAGTPEREEASPVPLANTDVRPDEDDVPAVTEEAAAESETPQADSGPASLGTADSGPASLVTVDSEAASVVAADSGPSSLTEGEGDQQQLLVLQQNGSAFVELLPDEQER